MTLADNGVSVLTRFGALIALALAFTFAASAASAEEGAGFVTGTISDESGRRIAGAVVEVQAEQRREDWVTVTRGRSESDGSYRLGPLPKLPSSVRMLVSAEGFASTSRMTFAGAQNSFRLAAGGCVRGVVRWEQSGIPVCGLEVVAEPESGSRLCRGVTDSAGNYRISNLHPGSYTLASGPWHLPQLDGVQFQIVAGETTLRDAWIPRGTSVFGRVSDADGRPVERAVVRCGSMKTTTDAQGKYQLDGVPPGGMSDGRRRSSVWAEAAGHAPTCIELVLAPGVPEFRWDVALKAHEAIDVESPDYVLIRDGVEVGPVSWFDTASAVFRCAESGSDRVASERALVAGEHRRTASKPQFARTRDGWIGAVVDAVPGSAPPGRRIAAMQPARIEGQLRTKDGGPVAYRSIRVVSSGRWSPLVEEGWLFEVCSDDLGRFALTVPPGDVMLHYGSRLSECAQIVALAQGATQKVEFVVEEERRLSSEVVGRVEDESGSPIEGATVIAWPMVVSTDAKGEFRMQAQGGRVVVKHPRFVQMFLPDLVGTTRPLVCVLRRGAIVRGRLSVGRDASPIRSFRVWISDQMDDSDSWTCHSFNDSDGRFSISSLPVGLYRLRVESAGRLIATLDGVAAHASDSTEEVVIRMEAEIVVRGVLLGASARPLAYQVVEGARVGSDGAILRFAPVAMTDATGRFVWPVSHGGRLALRARGYGVEGDAGRSSIINAVGSREFTVELKVSE
ncbi:MAG: hypothetical protein HMLKMBBP_03384 [Planctomycetes bacterium]|nr:hypothetical protein [Planctomycetota bacterium]